MRLLTPMQMLFTADDHLDDVMRARIWAKIAARIAADAPARARPHGPTRRWLPFVAAAAALAIAVTAIAIMVVTTNDANERTLVAPNDGALTVPLGPHTRAALVSGAKLVIEHTGDLTTVRLIDGTLYAEFTGGPGRALRIDAAGSTIEVVGTLFAVEVRGEEACVSVVHGKIRVTSAMTARDVSGGERACVHSGAAPGPTLPIEAATRDVLARYASTWVATSALANPTTTTASTGQVAGGAADPPTLPVVTASPKLDRPPLRNPRPARPPVGPQHSTDDELYSEAEAALARGDRDAADRALARLLIDTPRSPLVDEALYERARIAFERRAWPETRHFLDELALRPTTSLSEPAAYLRCRAAIDENDKAAAACLVAYRTKFPKGPHDREVGGFLIAIAFRTDGCAGIRGPLAEFASMYPGATAVGAWRVRCPEAP